MQPYKHEIANLGFGKVTGTWTDILQSNLLVLLTPHISPSLIINSENQKNTPFKEDNQNIPLAPINTKRFLPKF